MWSLLVVMLLALPVPSAPTAFDDTVAGASCSNRVVPDGSQLDCVFQVGASLKFTIAGVGQEGAAIAFERSSAAGDYYGKVGMLHSCVVVTPGTAHKNALAAGLAFVSPRSGKVFRTWVECRSH